MEAEEETQVVLYLQLSLQNKACILEFSFLEKKLLAPSRTEMVLLPPAIESDFASPHFFFFPFFFFFFFQFFASPAPGFGGRTLSFAAFTSGALLWGRSGAATPRGHGAVL